MAPLKALAFDAYGTILDPHSVMAECERLAPGRGAELSQLWRAKQLEYSWLRSLMERYEDFRSVTEAALAYACERLKIGLDGERRLRLMGAYERLAPYSDVMGALPGLSSYRLAVLSNGSLNMLEPAMRNSGLARWFEQVISVDAIGVYKPSPRVYQLAVDRLGLRADEIALVSANPFDVIGAKAFGLRAFWLRREGALLDHLGWQPDLTVRTLTDLSALAHHAEVNS